MVVAVVFCCRYCYRDGGCCCCCYLPHCKRRSSFTQVAVAFLLITKVRRGFPFAATRTASEVVAVENWRVVRTMKEFLISSGVKVCRWSFLQQKIYILFPGRVPQCSIAKARQRLREHLNKRSVGRSVGRSDRRLASTFPNTKFR